MSHEKALNLLRKLNELAKRGLDGERENAQNKLLELCLKHGISIEDLEEESKVQFEYKVSGVEERTFFAQISASCFGRSVKVYSLKGTSKNLIIECSKSQFLEVVSKHEFFYNIYKKELEVFYSAFIQRNELYLLPSDSEEDEDKEYTEEELERIRKIFKLSESMDQHTHYKQIEN